MTQGGFGDGERAEAGEEGDCLEGVAVLVKRVRSAHAYFTFAAEAENVEALFDVFKLSNFSVRIINEKLVFWRIY